jgi:hypothetical protein
MTPQDYIDAALEKSNDHAIRLGDLDDAIIGTDQNGLLVYDYSKILDVFIKKGMTADGAAEYADYNVVSTNAGLGFVIVYTN